MEKYSYCARCASTHYTEYLSPERLCSCCREVLEEERVDSLQYKFEREELYYSDAE